MYVDNNNTKYIMPLYYPAKWMIIYFNCTCFPHYAKYFV